jgi:dolichol kinase
MPAEKERRLESHSSIEIRREIVRKSLHLPGLLIPVAGQFHPWLTLIGVLLVSSLYLLSEQLRRTQKNPLPVFGVLTQKLTRNGRVDPAPVFLALGLGFSAFFLPWRAALAGAVLVCVCDGIAAVVGMRWGRRHWPWGPKTLLGSTAFFLAALVLLLPILRWEGALVTALAGTVLESLSIKGIDNFLLPIVGGLVAKYFL